MAMGRGRRERRHFDYWPGFVDALSTFLLTIIFLLSVFMLAQYFLSREISGKQDAVVKLRAQVNELTAQLQREQSGKTEDEQALARARAALAQLLGEKAALQQVIDSSKGAMSGLETDRTTLGAQLDNEKKATQSALNQVEILNQQIATLRQQMAALEAALGAQDVKDKESQTQITDLSRRLNMALAQKVQELGRYRSEFFGRLRDVLTGRSDVRIVGDRFVFPSEVLFAPGQATLSPGGLSELEKVGAALIEVGAKIPADIPWVLRVDGHTDITLISNQQFPSNWELSSARAIAVVRHLIAKGIPADRLAAAGFGEFQPIDKAETPEAHAKNRRIELKLTER